MNIEFVELDVVAIKAQHGVKICTVLFTQKVELENAKEYFQHLFRLRSHRTIANVTKMPQSTFYNPSPNDKYGLDENGLLVENGEYVFESIGRILNTKKVKITPKKESK
jgi:hypothetical protein